LFALLLDFAIHIWIFANWPFVFILLT